MLELNKVHHGDCLELMKYIPSGSVDMILCDLPYGTTQNKWDSIIPLPELWEQYERIIKENGAIVLTGQTKFTAMLITSNLKMHRYNLVYEKTNAGGFLNAGRMPLQAHEDICVFYKRLPTYNPQMTAGEPYAKVGGAKDGSASYGEFVEPGRVRVNKGVRYPRSVLKFSNGNHGSLHPTQKPVELMEYLIKTYTNEGETVLDNCIGSGTTAVAAINTGRFFIGIEQEKEYVDVANKRINEHQAVTS